MKPRERVMRAINHQETDRVPVDFGGTVVTGMQASVVYRLRQALKLDPEGTPVKVIEPYQVLGEIGEDLRQALGIDTVPLVGANTMFGFPNSDWKPWRLFDGTPVLVPGLFNTEPNERGEILMYPEGDRTAPPSGRMPKGGFYFDAIVRQPPIVESALDPKDNLEEFKRISEASLERFRKEAERLRRDTDYAVVASFGGTSFGDIAMVPAVQLKHPKGIRDVEEWYASLAIRRGYIYEVFEGQCEIAIQNLELVRQAVLDNVDVVFVSGADFGTQRGPFLSNKTYRDLFRPFHLRVNDWIHANTRWKTFIHSCGGVEPLVGEFIEAGFDILNPVQCSAEGMAPEQLKAKYGSRITFWGGGVDTQKTLPFGTPEQVKREVQERTRTFSKGGGFVFDAAHNVQAGTPVENLLAVFEGLGRIGGLTPA
ncbi:MAG: uroporphyrinogen decarboxylase family protein [Chloroflexota bacterium]|nr:uroporphyrinogen decarboxylase family protein [Chloroflexota bacterium]